MGYKESKIIREKHEKKETSQEFWRIFFIEGALYLFTSFLAIVCAFEFYKLEKAQKVYLPATSLQDFLLSFLLVTLFIFILVSYKRAGKFKEYIYKGLFMVTVFWGGMTIFNLLMPVFAAILLMGVLIVLWLEFPTVWIHDILIILGLAGAASFFGLSFTSSVMVVLLLIFSVYDFIAVYKTKHMVLIAKEMIEKKVILGFVIPKEFKYFKDKLEKIKPGGNFMILGGGDVVFPSLLAVSAIPSGFLKALIIILFSLAGCFLSYWLFSTQDKREPIPALPPIALFAIAGYLVTLLF